MGLTQSSPLSCYTRAATLWIFRSVGAGRRAFGMLGACRPRCGRGAGAT